MNKLKKINKQNGIMPKCFITGLLVITLTLFGSCEMAGPDEIELPTSDSNEWMAYVGPGTDAYIPPVFDAEDAITEVPNGFELPSPKEMNIYLEYVYSLEPPQAMNDSDPVSVKYGSTQSRAAVNEFWGEFLSPKWRQYVINLARGVTNDPLNPYYALLFIRAQFETPENRAYLDSLPLWKVEEQLGWFDWAILNAFNPPLDGKISNNDKPNFTKEWHYYRNELNNYLFTNQTEPIKYSYWGPCSIYWDNQEGFKYEYVNGEQVGLWSILPVGEAVFHMYGDGGEYAVKYISSAYKRFELVYHSKNNSIILDDFNMGTYNYGYGPNNSKMGHTLWDVIPFYYWGNTAEANSGSNLGYNLVGLNLLAGTNKSRFDNNVEAQYYYDLADSLIFDPDTYSIYLTNLDFIEEHNRTVDSFCSNHDYYDFLKHPETHLLSCDCGWDDDPVDPGVSNSFEFEIEIPNGYIVGNEDQDSASKTLYMITLSDFETKENTESYILISCAQGASSNVSISGDINNFLSGTSWLPPADSGNIIITINWGHRSKYHGHIKGARYYLECGMNQSEGKVSYNSILWPSGPIDNDFFGNEGHGIKVEHPVEISGNTATINLLMTGSLPELPTEILCTIKLDLPYHIVAAGNMLN